MGTDEDPLLALRDHVDFFEKLRDVNLPNSLENVRTSLLRRSRSILAAHEPVSSSPEPYLDMKPGKGKGLILPKLEKSDDTTLTEYIDADSNQIQRPTSPLSQNDYESFGNVPSNVTINPQNDKADEDIKKIYKSFSAEQTINKCHKSGPLYRREDDKWIFKERPCFIGLVGRHLLVYPKKDSKSPTEIFSIRNFSARPAPKLLPRDLEKAKSAFEVYAPGCPTLQFIARTPKEMDQWVAVINRVGSGEQSEKLSSETKHFALETLVPNIDSNGSKEEEQYQDVSQTEDQTEKSSIQKNETDVNNKSSKIALPSDVSSNPPPLPARIPRRLPSLPQEPTVAYEPDESYEKDDLYHTIEDMKTQTTYQNLKKPSTTKEAVVSSDNKKTQELELYDDIHGTKTKNEETLETYDDIALTESTKRQNSKESPKKKSSFLNRIKGKKESPKKKEKAKNIVAESPKAIEQELPTYDDVFEISAELKRDKNEEEELGNYTCPPAPRPVFTKSPPKFMEKAVEVEEEEVYDDVGHMRETEKVESSLSNENCELEHYQVPRVQDPIDLAQLNTTTEEELYDDVAILNEFRARKRDSACSSSSSEKTVNNVTKAWNRFASGKRTSEKINSKKNSSEECTETCVDSEADGNDLKRNKFQKLFNKMEYSLSKSGKPPISPIVNRYDVN